MIRWMLNMRTSILDKTRFSAFIGSSSGLDSLLRERKIETLIVSGTLSNVCCESTARDGMMLNYRSFSCRMRMPPRTMSCTTRHS